MWTTRAASVRGICTSRDKKKAAVIVKIVLLLSIGLLGAVSFDRALQRERGFGKSGEENFISRGSQDYIAGNLRYQ